MKVTIDHREKPVGVLRRTNLHGVMVTITFSEEELAIIHARDLKYDVVLERGFSADISDKKARKQQNRSFGRRMINAAVKGRDANHTDLTINKLMKGSDLFYLRTPLEAKTYEDALRERLVQLKEYIMGNEGITDPSSSFEL